MAYTKVSEGVTSVAEVNNIPAETDYYNPIPGTSDYHTAVPSGVTAFSGVIDSLVAAGGAVPNFWGSTSHRLYTVYTGPLLRVRRSSDNAEADIPYAAATNRLDTDALAAHCSGANGFVVTLYDQTGNSLNLTNATLNGQPKIYDSVAGTNLRGTLPWSVFTAALNQSLERGDAFGISGGSAVTFAYFADYTASATRRAVMVLGSGAGADFYSGRESDGNTICGTPGVSRCNHVALVGRTTPSGVVHRIAAGANVTAASARQDGTALSVASSAAGTLAIANTRASIGLASGIAFDGGGCSWVAAGTEYTGAPLAAIESFHASLKLLSV